MSTTPSVFLQAAPTSVAYRQKPATPIKTLRFSPYKLSQKGASSFQVLGHPHAHPNPPPPTYELPTTPIEGSLYTNQGQEFVATQHVKLDFELYQNNRQITPSELQQQCILDLFPTAFKLSFAPPFLIVACKILPKKPWPVTVAGMPLYLTTDGDTAPMDMGVFSQGPKLSIDYTISRWRTPDLQTFQQLFSIYDQLRAGIDRIQWIGWCFLVLSAKEPYSDWRKRLPFMVNNILIGYVFGEQAVSEKALRRKLPAGREPDDVAYAQLRPGVMVASFDQYRPSEFDVMTTSGICLKSPTSAKKYITVAKHGFPGGVGDRVMHPNRHGQCIAEVSKVFGDTDIALAELENPFISYSRSTFSAPDAAVSPFRNLLSVQELPVGDPIYMDTPYNGRCDGVLMKVEVLRIPSDEPADDVTYAIGIFGYFGNGRDTLFHGCCGAVLWNGNHDVLGQFRFPQIGPSGLCYCLTFETLKELGYIVAEN